MRDRATTRGLAAFALLLAACASRPHGIAKVDEAPLVLRSVDATTRGKVARVLVGTREPVLLLETGGVDSPRGDVRGELGDLGAEGSKWTDVVETDDLDQAGRWTVALTDRGVVVRVRSGAPLEPLNRRLGLPNVVRAIATTGPGLVVLADDGLVLLERERTLRIPMRGRALAASRHTIAIVRDDAVETLDLADTRHRTFSLPGVARAAFTGTGFLVAATDEALYRENGSGQLELRYVARDQLAAIAASGERIWFGDRDRVGYLEGDRVRLSEPLGVGRVKQIAPGASAVYVVGERSAKQAALPDNPPGVEPDIDRVVAHACASCHKPGGEAPFELASSVALRARRNEALKVLEDGSMPPGGRGLSSEDRVRLVDWLKR